MDFLTIDVVHAEGSLHQSIFRGSPRQVFLFLLGYCECCGQNLRNFSVRVPDGEDPEEYRDEIDFVFIIAEKGALV